MQPCDEYLLYVIMRKHRAKGDKGPDPASDVMGGVAPFTPINGSSSTASLLAYLTCPLPENPVREGNG